MAELEGYLRISDQFGNCTELINNCRTLAYLANTPLPSFRPAVVCEDCCCPSIDDNATHTTPDNIDEPAPWFDPLDPATTEFFGLWGSLNLAQPPLEDGIVPPKTITFSGVLLSGTKRGRMFGARWIEEQLNPLCVSCSGRAVTVYTYCPDDSCISEQNPIPQPDPPEPEPDLLDISNIFDADGCEIDGADLPLEPAGELAELVDTGQRDLLRVQYVAGSLQELEADFPDCYGSRITFQFELLDSETFLEGTPICQISPSDFGDGLDVPCRRICIDEPAPSLESCGACGVPCECETDYTIIVDGSAASNVLPDGAAECRYSAPLSCRRYACLTEPSPLNQVTPVMSLFAGSQDLENVSITVYQAVTGLPNPMTSLGAEIYGTRQPESTALISRVPAGSTLALDGRDSSLTLNCPGFPPASGSPLVSTCDGRRYRHPRFCCGLRYWIIIEVDCYTTFHDDWRLTGAVHGVSRQ